MEVEPLSNKRNPKFLAVAAGIAFLKKIHTCVPFPDRDLSTKGLIPLSSHIFLSASMFKPSTYNSYYFVTDPGNLVAKKKKFFQYYLLLFPILLPTKDHQQNSLHA